MIGTWKNIEDLEECLNLDELKRIIEAKRNDQHDDRKFYAAFKGVDLDEGKNNAIQERFDAVERRARARLTGETVEGVETRDAADILGLSYEVEE